MDKKQPPDPGNRDLDTDTTDDKITAFEEVAEFFRAGIQPAIFLTHSFLQNHPILLEEGYLTVNWDRIPGLYRRTDKLLMVSVTDKQWEKWGWSGGWTAWEPDTQPQNFFPNMAMVVCKGAFHDAQDPKLQTTVGHFISIARVPDCVQLLPFEQLREAFNNYTAAATAVGLVRLHRGNALFPDVYFQFYGEHFTIMGLRDPTIQFGTADEFVGGYLVRRHVNASGRKAHTMLPLGYVRGATHPTPSPTYPYRPCGTGVPGEQPPIHVVYMAALGTVLPSSQRFCIGEAPAVQWSFDGVAVPWILPESYHNPKGAVPDFPGDDNQAEGDNDKGSGTAPDGAPAEGEDDKDGEDDEGFETVEDEDEDTGGKVIVKIPLKDLDKPEGSGVTGADQLFDSDDEEDDAGLREQIETAYQMADTIDELKLSETSSSSSSESSDSEDDDADPDETKPLPQPEETEGVGETGSGPASTANPALEGSGNPGGPGPDVVPKENPSETTGTKGKGPNSKESGKAPAAKPKLSTSAEGVRERAQTTLFGGAALAQAMGSEEDVTRRLENYTGLLDGLQKLVGVMASGYEDATEDIRSLVASTLDAATQRDRAFVAGASQALTEWTTTYQQAMSQGETRSIPEQLARWDRVREAGIALSRTVTSLTNDHKESTALGEIFQCLLPACFQRVRVRTEATFSQLHASLPTMLCRFVAPDQAGQIFSSIFTCMCNYNTEICGMAMAQTVVLVYTIPNTYRVQQSLWESLCRTIPGIARNNPSGPRPAQQSSNPSVGAKWGSPWVPAAPEIRELRRPGRVTNRPQLYRLPARREAVGRSNTAKLRSEFLRPDPFG